MAAVMQQAAFSRLAPSASTRQAHRRRAAAALRVTAAAGPGPGPAHAGDAGDNKEYFEVGARVGLSIPPTPPTRNPPLPP
jgi:hypothetical protein